MRFQIVNIFMKKRGKTNVVQAVEAIGKAVPVIALKSGCLLLLESNKELRDLVLGSTC